MFIHYHSLYAGIIVYGILLLLGAHVAFGVLGIVACLATDYQNLKMRFKKHDRANAYAIASLLQAAVLFQAYVLLYAVMYARMPVM